MTKLSDEATLDRARKATLLGRIAKPGDVAWVVAFFLHPGSRHCTALTVDINGGQYMGS